MPTSRSPSIDYLCMACKTMHVYEGPHKGRRFPGMAKEDAPSQIDGCEVSHGICKRGFRTQMAGAALWQAEHADEREARNKAVEDYWREKYGED